MYRITREIAHYLLETSKDFHIPGLSKETDKPFVIGNQNSIGSINPFLVVASDAKFIVETDAPEVDAGTSEVPGFWLYKQNELKAPDDLIEMPRASLDHYSTNPEEQLNITDCIIELPSPIDKLTCLSVSSIERLFSLEPDLKGCLDPEKEELYERIHKR